MDSRFSIEKSLCKNCEAYVKVGSFWSIIKSNVWNININMWKIMDFNKCNKVASRKYNCGYCLLTYPYGYTAYFGK